MNYPFVHTVLAAAVLSTFAFNAHAAQSAEERMASMEARMNAIEAENQSLKTQLKSTEKKVVAASEQVEKVVAAAPSAKASWAEKNRIGGYGELHYNNLNGEGGAAPKNELDLHRFVLFFGHEFNERTRFFSELEVEHSIAGEGKVGEIELEQAYVEFDLNDRHRAKAGLFMMPVGIINETHEPPVFYGVERNPVEANIVPATWWGGGVALSGQLGSGFSYDLALQEGLNTTSAKSYKPRDGRQKTGSAVATDFATTARLKWTGLPGVELAGSVQHQSDITQGLDATAGSAQLYELHGILNRGPFGLKALYAQWNLDGSGPAAKGADKQVGWYIEPTYRINEKWGVFARYNAWDNAAGDATKSAKQQTDFGINYWPHPDVVIKADYQTQDHDDGKNQNGFNLGVGYQF